jgi:hypothetical protein
VTGLSDDRNAALRAQADALDRICGAIDDGLHDVADALRAVALTLAEANRISARLFGPDSDAPGGP